MFQSSFEILIPTHMYSMYMCVSGIHALTVRCRIWALLGGYSSIHLMVTTHTLATILWSKHHFLRSMYINAFLSFIAAVAIVVAVVLDFSTINQRKIFCSAVDFFYFFLFCKNQEKNIFCIFCFCFYTRLVKNRVYRKILLFISHIKN